MIQSRHELNAVRTRRPPAATVIVMLTLLACQSTPGLAANAQEIVQLIAAAYGGTDELEAVQSLEYELTGYRISRHQSRLTEPPYDRIPVSSFYAIDYPRNLGVADGIGSYPGGLVFPFRTIIGPDGEVSLDTGQKTFHRGSVMMGIDDLKSSAARNLPPLLAREMSRRPAEVDYRGMRSHLGQEYLYLVFGTTGVLVHPRTHRVYATLSTRGDMATNGSMETMRIYQDSVVHDGIAFPRAVYDYLPAENAFITDYRLTFIRLNRDISEHLVIPESFVPAGNPHMGYANDGELRARPIFDGVFLAGDNNTNVLYVEFDDYFVAMEAGGMAWYAEAVYDAMQPHMKGKPLRYIVPTHYHDDHAVGLRFYTRIGATILTTPEKAGFLRRLLEPVDDGILVQQAKFEWIDGSSHRFEDRTGALEILVYADSPHTENMLIGYLPRGQATFSADLFVGWGGTTEIRQGATHGLKHYAAWLEGRLGSSFSDIRIWIPVHGRPYSTAEIQAMLARPLTLVRLPDNRTVDAENWFLEYGLIDETISGRRNVLDRRSR